MNNMPGTSADILADNIAKIKQLFPEVFTEDKIDFERLQEVLGEYIEDKDERYRFEWNGKSSALRLSQTQSTGTLRPCKEESKDWDTTENLYIEGDNLEVLKLLQKTYHNRIKMIYIDPPYNTGGDFVYKDDFKDNIKNYLEITGQTDEEGKKLSTNSETSGRYHTDWLNMMYPRLRLARNLLADDGVILVSIGDRELSNVIHVLNQIFGESNQVCIFTWKSRAKPTNAGNSKFRPQKVAEYILVYGKTRIDEAIYNVVSSKERVYPHSDNQGQYRLTTILTSNRGTFRRETMRFESNGYKPNSDFRWKAGKETIDNLFNTNHMEFNDEGIPMEKKYAHEEQDPLYPIYCYMESDLTGTAETGKSDLSKLIGNKHGFDTVKPVQLLKYLISTFSDQDSIIMDFFSGSATTAEAVIEKNVEDEDERKFILVQFPEFTYEPKMKDKKNSQGELVKDENGNAVKVFDIDKVTGYPKIQKDSEAREAGYYTITQIGRTRIHKAGEKIKEELQGQQLKLGEEPKKVPDIGFKVFKLDSSNLKKWNPDYENLESSLINMVSNYVDGRTEEDVLYEIMLKYGIDLTYPIEIETVEGKQIFNIGFGSLYGCLADNIDMSIAEYIVKKRDELMPDDEDHIEQRKSVRVVFKDNGFKDDSTKTNVEMELERCGFEEVVSV